MVAGWAGIGCAPVGDRRRGEARKKEKRGEEGWTRFLSMWNGKRVKWGGNLGYPSALVTSHLKERVVEVRPREATGKWRDFWERGGEVASYFSPVRYLWKKL